MKRMFFLLGLGAMLLFSACGSRDQPAEEATATPGVSPATPGEPLANEADTATSLATDTTTAPRR